jgi:uncharacterized protein (DUF1499 family)
MKPVKLLFSSIIILIAALGGLAFMSNTGQPPGLNHEQLTPCPNKPNCVRSERDSEQNHFIEPIKILPEQQQQAMFAIKTSIVELGGQIQSEQTNYLASTFSSTIFGFIDDIEIRIDPKLNRIHLRSASRVGYSDLGVNRKRADVLKTTIQHHLNTMIGTLRDQ